MAYILRRVQVIPGRLAPVFAFFRDPWNLEAITPPWLAFRILRTSDEVARKGTRISYRLRLHGVPIRWESVIAEYEDGVAFADAMLAGPYRSWYHRHSFREVRGGVEMEDHVEYTLPFGVFGRLAHALVVRPQLDRIFAYRSAAIAATFGSPPPEPCVLPASQPPAAYAVTPG